MRVAVSEILARTSNYLPSFFPTGSSYFTPTHHPDLNSVFPTDNEISNIIIIILNIYPG